MVAGPSFAPPSQDCKPVECALCYLLITVLKVAQHHHQELRQPCYRRYKCTSHSGYQTPFSQLNLCKNSYFGIKTLPEACGQRLRAVHSGPADMVPAQCILDLLMRCQRRADLDYFSASERTRGSRRMRSQVFCVFPTVNC